jgi:hypothetical protein
MWMEFENPVALPCLEVRTEELGRTMSAMHDGGHVDAKAGLLERGWDVKICPEPAQATGNREIRAGVVGGGR